MASRTFPPRSWVDPRVEVQDSDIYGRGAFASGRFRSGEVVAIFGGAVFSAAQIARGEAQPGSYSPIAPGLYPGTPAGRLASAADYINHSCDPSIWLLDDGRTWVARCDIDVGVELAADYATFNLP